MSILCIFAIEKVEISKQTFYKGKFRIRLRMFTANFKVVREKQLSYGRFTFCVFFAFFVLKRFKFQKNIF